MSKLVPHDPRQRQDAAIVPPTRVGGLIAWLVVAAVALVGGLGTWMSMARLETAVIAAGEVKVDGRLRTIQHLEGGMVEEVLVREGQRVSEGDLMLRLDGTRVRAQLGILRSQYAEALAREARLAAEFDGSATLTLGNELATLIRLRPGLWNVAEAQQALLSSNLDSDFGEVQILRERVAQQSRQRDGLALARQTVERQLEIVREDLVGLEQLNAQGLVPRQRYSERLEDLTRLEGSLSGNASEDAQVARQIAALEQQVRQIQRDRRRAIAGEQQEVRTLLFDLRERLGAMEDIERRLEIRAPNSGRVIGLAISTVGEVVSEGMTVLQIVPEDADYIVAARVSPDDIDEVRVGSDARVRLSAYSVRTTPPLLGKVRDVSADRLIDPTSGQPYFAIEVTIDPTSLTNAPGVDLLPGMAGQVMVTTGAETVMTYLLDPLLRGLETAMTESY